MRGKSSLSKIRVVLNTTANQYTIPPARIVEVAWPQTKSSALIHLRIEGINLVVDVFQMRNAILRTGDTHYLFPTIQIEPGMEMVLFGDIARSEAGWTSSDDSNEAALKNLTQKGLIEPHRGTYCLTKAGRYLWRVMSNGD